MYEPLCFPCLHASESYNDVYMQACTQALKTCAWFHASLHAPFFSFLCIPNCAAMLWQLVQTSESSIHTELEVFNMSSLMLTKCTIKPCMFMNFSMSVHVIRNFTNHTLNYY